MKYKSIAFLALLSILIFFQNCQKDAKFTASSNDVGLEITSEVSSVPIEEPLIKSDLESPPPAFSSLKYYRGGFWGNPPLTMIPIDMDIVWTGKGNYKIQAKSYSADCVRVSEILTSEQLENIVGLLSELRFEPIDPNGPLNGIEAGTEHIVINSPNDQEKLIYLGSIAKDANGFIATNGKWLSGVLNTIHQNMKLSCSQ